MCTAISTYTVICLEEEEEYCGRRQVEDEKHHEEALKPTLWQVTKFCHCSSFQLEIRYVHLEDKGQSSSRQLHCFSSVGEDRNLPIFCKKKTLEEVYRSLSDKSERPEPCLQQGTHVRVILTLQYVESPIEIIS